MSATALQLNWTAVSFAAGAITRVTAVTFSQGGELIEFAGDNNRYPVVIANNINRPMCSITSGDVATLMGISPGRPARSWRPRATRWALTGGGDRLDDDQRRPRRPEDSGQWGRFATATATFRAYASDGATNPLSFTRV